MKLAAPDSRVFAIAVLCLVFAGGCVGAMPQGEAQMYAAASLRKFCRDQPCGAFHLVAAQKLKDRWLVDYESPAAKYTVFVDRGGNTQVNVWDKSLAR